MDPGGDLRNRGTAWARDSLFLSLLSVARCSSSAAVSSIGHGDQGQPLPISRRSGRAWSLRAALGCDSHTLLPGGWAWRPADLRWGRAPPPPMRELLGLLQHILRAGPVVMELRPLRRPQWPHLWGDRPLLPSAVMPRDDLLLHRSGAPR